MTEGQAVLIFPFQPHSYTPLTEDETHTLYIFSPSLVPSYYNALKNKLPLDSLFPCPALEQRRPKNRFAQKALAYFLCSEFDEGREYVDKPAKLKDGFFEKLLLFVNNNFTEVCSLKEACDHVGYDYAYISKKFKNLMGMSFKEYVNLLRISEAKQLLANTELSVGEIAEKCGFSTLRTFDREFFSHLNMTPTEYRKK
jgi:AraC-like DNA-binding protein